MLVSVLSATKHKKRKIFNHFSALAAAFRMHILNICDKKVISLTEAE
jgi:hypothetical protein